VFICVICGCIVPAFIFAEESPNNTITSIRVTGLKRTKPIVIKYALEKFIGKDASKVDLTAVHAAIMDTGVVEPIAEGITDDPDGNGKVLDVQVREKWTFIPTPIGMVDSDGNWSIGAFLLDANTFGLRDQFVVGAMYGQAGWLGMASYTYTAEKDHVPDINISGSYSSKQITYATENNKTLMQFNRQSFKANLGASYPITNFFKAAFSISYLRNSLVEKNNADWWDKDPGFQPSNYMAAGFTPRLILHHSSWDGYLLADQAASLDYSAYLGLEGSSFYSTSFRGLYKGVIIPGFLYTAAGGATYISNDGFVLKPTISSFGVNIMPRNFSARSFVGGALGLEKYLYKFRWCTISLLASYQTLWAHTIFGETVFGHGPAGSIRLDLNRIAIPAMGFGVAYNVKAQEFQWFFNVGMSF
jgi:hypothetical protein